MVRFTTKSFAAIAVCAALQSYAAMAETYHWLQYAPAGLEVRAVTDQAACPPATVDGAPQTMAVRAAPGEHYPVTACTLPLPAGTKSAAIAGVPVAMPSREPTRIAVIGDTGCRLKGMAVQACNDPQKWPFRLIAEVVAQLKPDLVIHVGDYHYRETPCPEGEAGCAGSPFGDNWPVWRADFFAPADTLLRVAPWVLVRGNHEDCERGGKGWSRILDPYAFDTAKGCNDIGKPLLVRLPGLTLAVMDVATAREERVDDSQVPAFRDHYRALAEVTGPIWIVQHRPIWSPGGTFGGKLIGDSKTLAVAADGLIPENVGLMLSGHHHLFQVLQYQTNLPVQIVSGNSGDALNPGAPTNPAGWVVNGVTVKSGLHVPGSFGFSMFEKKDGGWQITNYDRLGAARTSCVIKDRAATC
ncbi:MAG TPA: metallophosphoesterase [Pseudolabrys sp.]|nr:metallophosphoesterase [Pseudolabrys sp.]